MLFASSRVAAKDKISATVKESRDNKDACMGRNRKPGEPVQMVFICPNDQNDSIHRFWGRRGGGWV